MAFALSGCLYSTHHFHSGMVLSAGKSEVLLGMGRQPVWTCNQGVGDTLKTKVACAENPNGGQSVHSSNWGKASLDYRLGIRDHWGPFPGVELQWHLEMPTNPASMEFALNFALPQLTWFHHKLGGGWGVGAWADDSFFAEYAFSLLAGANQVFTNLRVTYLATQIGDVLGEDFAKPFPSNQHWVFQSAYGMVYRLPDWPILPDFLIPEINLTLPSVPSGEQKFKPSDIPTLQWDINLGLGWAF
jgi:hypothetical protein